MSALIALNGFPVANDGKERRVKRVRGNSSRRMITRCMVVCVVPAGLRHMDRLKGIMNRASSGVSGERMVCMAVVVHVDGTQETIAPQTPPAFTLEELHALVGGWIEVVYLPDGRLLVIDEEGKLKGYPRNEQATRLAAGRLFSGDYIAGTAVLVSLQEMGE